MNRTPTTAALVVIGSMITAFVVAVAVAFGATPAPTFTNTSTYRAINATVTATEPGVYKLDSTFFVLGTDPWGRTRQSVTLAAGQTYSFVYPCRSTRATYGYRVVTPSATGPAIWVKCQ